MRRKVLILMSVCAANFIQVSAEDKCEGKQESGYFGTQKFSTELSFNPFDQNGKTFELDALRFRYFISKKHALRVGLGFAFSKDKVNEFVDSEIDIDGILRVGSLKTNAKTNRFSVDLGYENHFLQRGRFDVFAGASLGIAKENYSFSYEFIDADTKGWYMSKFKGCWSDYEDFNTRANITWNTKLFLGADFYIYKGLFLGTELGLKISSKKYCDATLVVTNHAVYNNSNKVTLPAADVKSFDIKLYAVPTFRIGWTF